MSDLSQSTKIPDKTSCSLCEKEISHYSIEFNHLEIDDDHAVDICRECLDKLFKWQQSVYAKLFPTKVMKKIARKDVGRSEE